MAFLLASKSKQLFYKLLQIKNNSKYKGFQYQITRIKFNSNIINIKKMVKQKQNTIQLNFFRRALMLVLIFIQYALYFYTLILTVNYQIIALRFVTDYASPHDTLVTEPHYLWNFMLLISFWLQHIPMATSKYKLKLFNTSKYFVLYERFIFNIFSGVFLWLIFAFAKPSNNIAFQIPLWVSLPFLVIGLFFFLNSYILLNQKNMLPYSISDIISKDVLIYRPYGAKTSQTLVTNGVYSLVRNPMHTGYLLIFIFGNNTYTYDNLIFIAAFIIGIVIGVEKEEQRMKNNYAGYEEYRKQVKSKYIPYLI